MWIHAKLFEFGKELLYRKIGSVQIWLPGAFQSFLELPEASCKLPGASQSHSFPELPRAFQKLPRSFRSFPETSGAELPGIFSELPGSLLELPGAAQELPGASLSNEVLYRKAGSTPVCTNLVRNYITRFFEEYLWNRFGHTLSQLGANLFSTWTQLKLTGNQMELICY